ncbi:hypothetical protein Ppb6_01718 [Photorhabdus australis subsp. thailandensis]|uniref:Uncharacterized protein n=1 Tax=Photorhabdus australis subsp. thailandensis TaxID=2805096 RepID=A0A1C0U579_9GAMM|nr:hypothetical protein Ppb6_01718 [Photorhabdus australis subsp. thailandensis]
MHVPASLVPVQAPLPNFPKPVAYKRITDPAQTAVPPEPLAPEIHQNPPPTAQTGSWSVPVHRGIQYRPSFHPKSPADNYVDNSIGH